MRLLDLRTDELIATLKAHGVTAGNVTWRTNLYEAGDTVKAVIAGDFLNPPADKTGRMESVGFFYWIDTNEYWRLYNEAGGEKDSRGIDAAGAANLKALKRLLE